MTTEHDRPADAPAPPRAKPIEGLGLLRQPVEDRYIAKLPKPTSAQTEAVKKDFQKGMRCRLCGAWHHPDVVHLDYVGHAATTARLLEVDERWSWEPVAFDQETGLPKFDHRGGLWIRLTIMGVTRYGYGNADDRLNQDAGTHEKECIGDAIRNAAMRFGWALDLWHKGGDLFQPSVHEDPAGEGRGDAGPPADAVEGQVRREPARAPAPKPEKLAYTDKQLRANADSWTDAIADKRTTADKIIATISARYTMTAKQRADIKKLQPRN